MRTNFFEGYKILETLHLSNNKLLALPDLHWVEHTLKDIQAAYNGIESLDVFQRSGFFKSLSYINMGGNSIRTFNITILLHVPKLRFLLLNSNQLAHMDDFRIYYKNMIYFKGNPWHCGTALSWMGEDDMAFENGLVCETPACLQGIAISDMSNYDKWKHTHLINHDDVIKWKHFTRYWPFVRGIHRSPVNSPHKGQWRGALVFTLICARINGWVNNREAGDLRRHRAHYDVIVMTFNILNKSSVVINRCSIILIMPNPSLKPYT